VERFRFHCPKLSDSTIVTITYGHWVKGEEPYIVSARFNLEETDRIVARELKDKR